jgi:large subunit ribosomal protein L18
MIHTHHTLVAASTLEQMRCMDENSVLPRSGCSHWQIVAERALKAGITQVVFDRGGKLYHGRVAALAEAAREAGLEF